MKGKWVAAWLILALIIGFGIGSLNIPRFEHLINRGVQAQATVVELTPKIHNTVRYEYQVGGAKFYGQTQLWLPNPPIDQINVGQSLVVYYDPQNPSLSVLGDPKPMLTNEIIAVGMAALMAPTFIVFVLAVKEEDYERKKRSKDKNEPQG